MLNLLKYHLKDSSVLELARGAIGALTVKIGGAIIALLLHLLLARMMGITEYGIYAYAVGWINILAVIAMLGSHTSLIRFIAAYKVNEQWSLLTGLLQRSMQAVLACSITMAIIGVICVRTSHLVTEQQATALYIACGALPFTCITKLREAGLRALKKIVLSEMLMRALHPLILDAMVVAIYLFSDKAVTANVTMLANIFSLMAIFCLGSFWLRKTLPRAVLECIPAYSNRVWISVSLPLLLIASMNMLIKRVDIVMVGAIVGPEEAGAYSVASRLADVVLFALAATNSILGPIVAELYYTGKHKKLQLIITSAARGVFIFASAVTIIVVMSGEYLLSLFGKDFISGYSILIILLLAQMINALSGPVALLMTMTASQNMAGVIITASGLINVILNFLMVPTFGSVGAALATATTTGLWNILMLCYVNSRLHINSTIFRVRKVPV